MSHSRLLHGPRVVAGAPRPAFTISRMPHGLSSLASVALVAGIASTFAFGTACSSGSTPAAPATTPGSTSATAQASPQESGAAQPSANSAALGACSLAEASEVASAYGEQFGAGQSSSPGGYSSCLFPPQRGAVDSVSFTVAQGSQADQFFTSNKAAYSGADVSSLGDKAFASGDGGAVGVEKGDVAILVHVVGFEKVAPADLMSKQVAFAKLLVSHLP